MMLTSNQERHYGPIETDNFSTPKSMLVERSGVDWLLFLSILVSILLSGAVQYFDIFFLAAANLAIQVLLLWRVRFRFSRKTRQATLVIFLYLFYSILLEQPGSHIFIIYRFHDIFTALLVLNYLIIRRPDFARTLEMVLIFLLLHGFLNWLVVMTTFPLFSPSADVKAYRFLVFFGMNEQYMGIHRSQGLFWEPGVYQIYLNVAMHYFLFYARKRLWVGLSLLGLILTLSTTGVVIAGLQLLYWLLFSRIPIGRKILLILALLPGLVFYANFSKIVVQDKISGERSGSYLARSFDTINGTLLALEYPLGIGFDPNTYQEFARENVFGINTPLVTDRGQTNGILIMTYSTGFFWALVFLIFTFRQNIFPTHRIMYFVVLVGSMLTEPLTFSPFFFLFTLSGMIGYRPLFRAPAAITVLWGASRTP